jgi:hypothetical protein
MTTTPRPSVEAAANLAVLRVRATPPELLVRPVALAARPAAVAGIWVVTVRWVATVRWAAHRSAAMALAARSAAPAPAAWQSVATVPAARPLAVPAVLAAQADRSGE